MKRFLYLMPILFATVMSDCPWSREDPETSPLTSACLCAINPKNEYSIQCSSVKFPLLMGTLHARTKDFKLNLLYVNNSIIEGLNDKTFFGLHIKHLQLSFCGLTNISDGAFEGLEDTLQHLYLQDNRLQNIPSSSLLPLQKLDLLDLTRNRLTTIPPNSFAGLNINTLKLSGNTIRIMPETFSGIEKKLKNLNLKECNLPEIPSAVRKLESLAFLDLAQNEIRNLPPGALEPLHSLTALNLERNLLQELTADSFKGVSDTLSSLSLLNNLLTKFPVEAINALPQLRVLDIGFNLITRIPNNAFHGIQFLTLLAVDGNPLPALPELAFKHLNGTLRGLSVGGRYLVCDCRASWIAEWIRDSDLRVTSRDRDPQFCGQPLAMRDKTFYQLSPSEFVCKSHEPSTTEIPKSQLPPLRKGIVDNGSKLENRMEIKSDESDSPINVEEKNGPTTSSPAQSRRPFYKQPPLRRQPLREKVRTGVKSAEESNEAVSTYKPPLRTTTSTSTTTSSTTKLRTTTNKSSTYRQGSAELQDAGVIPSDDSYKQTSKSSYGTTRSTRRPPLVLRPERPKSPEQFYSNTHSEERTFGEEVIVQDAYWDSNAINIQWDSEVTNILGFRVVYRLFGDSYFKMGQPLSPTAREFKIKNVPAHEYFVACVVSLEEMDIKLESVPFGQCREIRTGDAASKLSTHMDKIIIAASASICGTVIIAVIIFICCYRGRKSPPEKQGLPAVLNPSSPPLASLGALGGGSTKTDWDTISMYSQRSIPRARMYHMDKEDTRSHISHMSTKSRARSLADGQSQRSYSGVHLPTAQFMPPPLSLSRPDLRLSRQSLNAQFGPGPQYGANPQYGGNAQFGANYPHFGHAGGMISRAASQRSDRRRSRSKSRDRSGSRLSHAGSSHSLTGYDTDGWTDHDMDIYMARNPTRGGLVQL